MSFRVLFPTTGYKNFSIKVQLTNLIYFPYAVDVLINI